MSIGANPQAVAAAPQAVRLQSSAHQNQDQSASFFPSFPTALGLFGYRFCFFRRSRVQINTNLKYLITKTH